MSNQPNSTLHRFKTTNIKGKEYVEVNQRVLYFRNNPAYSGWSMESTIIAIDDNSCVVRTVIRDESDRIRATGIAQEDRTSSNINKTSYVENCETSSWGRALGCLGIGIETSIASANEVSMAIEKQNLMSAPPSPLAKPIQHDDIYQKALAYLMENPTKEAFDKVLQKYNGKFNQIQISSLSNIVNK